jgi:hypothetical protein
MAMTKTKRRRRETAEKQSSQAFVEILKHRLGSRDLRSHAEFLHDMRAKQAAGQLANRATAALLDRLERASNAYR